MGPLDHPAAAPTHRDLLSGFDGSVPVIGSVVGRVVGMNLNVESDALRLQGRLDLGEHIDGEFDPEHRQHLVKRQAASPLALVDHASPFRCLYLFNDRHPIVPPLVPRRYATKALAETSAVSGSRS